MTELTELYKKLEQYSSFDQDEKNCELFLDTVDEIVLKGDPKSIKELFKYFDDESEYDWVMESLMIALESYKTEDFLKEFLLNLEQFLVRSELRTKGLFYGILNSGKDYQILKSNIKNFCSDELKLLLEIIYKESPYHCQLIQELRKKIETSSKE